MSVLASIDPVELQVEPGAETSLTVRVRNRGTIVDRFDVAVVGPMARWATVEPNNLRLFPDKEGEARITFRPPRAPEPAADMYPFGVAVRPVSDPEGSTVEEGRVTVGPFVELGTEIVPQTSRGSRSGTHELTVHNRGNAVAQVTAHASDPDRLLRFEVVPERAGLRPGGKATLRTKVIPKDSFLTGTPKRIPFSISVDEPMAGSYQVPASLEQRAIIPGWLMMVAGLAIAGAIAAIAFVPGLLGGDANASPSAVAVVSPTPEVTLAPIETLGPPTEGPTPTPRLGPPDVLVAAGDDTPLNNSMGMSVICPTGDGCRELVKERIIQILGNLLGKADGAILVSFDTTTTGTLPVVATWTDWHYPYSAQDGTKGDATEVAIDLAPLLGGGSAYALVQDVSGQKQYFVVPGGNAKLLFDALYTAPVQPTPAPDPGGGTIFYDNFYNVALFNGQLIRQFSFTATPPP